MNFNFERLPLSGALLVPLKIMTTPAGAVMHVLRPGSPLMPDFPLGLGEIYFSEVYAGDIKAWKCHCRQSQNMAVPMGQLLFVLYDGRRESPTHGAIVEILLGRPDNYQMLHIPPGIWYGFKALGDADALICNCADLPHDPEEGLKLPLNTAEIPYQW